MTLVNPATDDERTGGITDNRLDELHREQSSEVVVLDLRLREIEAFAVIREMAGIESPGGRPTRALAVRCLAARVVSRRTQLGADDFTTQPGPLDRRSDDLRRALAFSEYLEWRIDDLNRTGDALGLL